ncbi:MAG TPA: hypothetical protein VFJ16_15105 [Longimicrobium sp.]|nr:hypothetical protein [Longimicrobium sp.]
MDRNDDGNPGMVERQMDETPMEGASSSDRELSRDGLGGMDRERLQDGGSVEREGMQGGSPERESLQGSEGMDREPMSGSSQGRDSMDLGSSDGDSLTGRESDRLGVTNTNANDAEMRVSSREGGYGYDRPADLTVNSDMEASSRDTDQGTDRVRNLSDGAEGGSSNTPARDW